MITPTPPDSNSEFRANAARLSARLHFLQREVGRLRQAVTLHSIFCGAVVGIVITRCLLAR